MESTVKHITQKILVLLMAGLVGLLIANTALFLHVHQLEDGTIISHAHPYNKTDDAQPIKKHHHSKLDILIIHSLDILFVQFFFSLVPTNSEKKLSVLFDLSNTYQLYFYNTIKGRAPPAVNW